MNFKYICYYGDLDSNTINLLEDYLKLSRKSVIKLRESFETLQKKDSFTKETINNCKTNEKAITKVLAMLSTCNFKLTGQQHFDKIIEGWWWNAVHTAEEMDYNYESIFSTNNFGVI